MQKLIELIKYGFFGAVTTAINLLLFALLKEMGMYYILANTLSYIVAVVINYFFNQRYVFEAAAQKGTKQAQTQFYKFVFLRIVSLAVDNALFYLLVTLLHLPVYPSRIGLSLAIILATYFINKVFVFSSRGTGK